VKITESQQAHTFKNYAGGRRSRVLMKMFMIETNGGQYTLGRLLQAMHQADMSQFRLP
jgi:hypothetical protein